MKNKLVAALLIVALFIPTVVAVVEYFTQLDEVTATNVEYIEFTDPAGVKSSFDRNGTDEEKEMLDFFINVKSNSEEIKEPPTTVNDKIVCVTNVFTTSGEEKAFKFYFTSNKKDCYFVDGNGDTYQINESYALIFLNSKYAGFVFENGSAPVMTLAGSGTMVPDSSAWNFVGADGKFIAAATTAKEETESVQLEGGLNITFTAEPDLFNVKVINKSDGIEIFNDEYANIAALTIGTNMTVSVEITAKWYQEDAKNFYGEQTYKFDASVAAPAEFYAGTNTIQIGEFICVTAVNVNNPENISFKSEPDISFVPTFYKDGDYSYALIPFHNGLEVGEYKLTFTYGSASQDVSVTLGKRDNAFGTREKVYPDAVVQTLFTDEKYSAAAEVLKPLTASGSSERYFDGSFCEAVDTKIGAISLGYGHTLSISGTDKSFQHTGVDYVAAAGTYVLAGNAGEVVYVGYTDYTGYIVVIEHGYGLKSWYAHLESKEKITVEVGDKVKAGDIIGTCGGTGLIDQNGVHCGYTVKDTVVCQYTLWSDGNNKGIPVYDPEA